ncbi:MFS transporter [Sulfuriflexus mobilis]|uniref:MFS transporter n=1 Tax=Sulfuriflexus mobilis TaxID=1811807 RepID=UPI000F84D704|nr:MFS transporter [Sulfuriflexus mobilis]
MTRNVPLLATCQALMMSGNSLLIATSALVGFALAEDKALATLPLAAQFIATMLTSIPAALLMERIGRKPGFMLATLLGLAGGVIATLAILNGEFWWFLLGAVLFGSFNGFGIYYRFAAADAVDVEHKSRAISYVMAGGVVAAVVGPNLARFTRESVEGALFAGSYASMIVIYMLALFTLSFIKLPPKPAAHAGQKAARPLKQIAAQPKFIVAITGATLGYAVMSLVMTATPLAMHNHAYAFADTSFVIQWHVLGMFAPSFFTGQIIRRFGVLNVMFTGGLLGVACIVINLLGTSLWHFWGALLLLGISWNFLFVGATTLLTETYRPNERAKTQAMNDFTVFTTVSIAILSAGALQHNLGWEVVNIGALPMLAIVLASIVWLRNKTANEVKIPTDAVQDAEV